MATNSLGRLTLDLAVRLSEFTDGLTRAERETRDRTENMGNSVGKFKNQLIEDLSGTPIGGAVDSLNEKLSSITEAFGEGGLSGAAAIGAASVIGSVVAIGAGLVALALKTAEADDELVRLSERARISTKDMQVLSAAAGNYGKSMDSVSNALLAAQRRFGKFSATGGGGLKDTLKLLQKSTGMADAELEKFGKSLSTVDTVEAIQMINDKLEDAGATSQEVTFVMSSLSRGLVDLIPMWANNGEEIKEYEKQLEQAGVIRTKESIKQTQLLAGELEGLKIKFEGVSNQVVTNTLPAMVGLIEYMKTGTTDADGLSDSLSSMGVVAATIATPFIGLITVFKQVGTVVAGLMGSISALFSLMSNVLSNPFKIGTYLQEYARSTGQLGQYMIEDMRAERDRAAGSLETIWSSPRELADKNAAQNNNPYRDGTATAEVEAAIAKADAADDEATAKERTAKATADASKYIQYANKGATRNQQLNPELEQALSFLQEEGIVFKVNSGGQPGIGTSKNRVGSTAHDNGYAADGDLYQNGRKLDWNNSKDLPLLKSVVEEAAARGINGIGAGNDYMGAGRFHFGIQGQAAAWGKGGKSANALPWVKEAHSAGTNRKASNTFYGKTLAQAAKEDEQRLRQLEEHERSKLSIANQYATAKEKIELEHTNRVASIEEAYAQSSAERTKYMVREEERYTKEKNAAALSIMERYQGEEERIHAKHQKALKEIEAASIQDDSVRQMYIDAQNAAYQEDLANFKFASQAKMRQQDKLYQSIADSARANGINSIGTGLDAMAQRTMSGNDYQDWRLAQDHDEAFDSINNQYANREAEIYDEDERGNPVFTAMQQDELILIAKQEHLDAMWSMEQEFALKQIQLDEQQRVQRYEIYQGLFNGLAGLTKAFAGEQSGAYRVMFAIEKGFAIAQSVMAIQQSIAKAMSIGFPANIPVIAQTVGQGAQILSSIKSVQSPVAGIAHGGLTNVPEEATYLLQRDERVLSPKQNKDITNFIDNYQYSNAGNITINNNSSAEVSATRQPNGEVTIDMVNKMIEKSFRRIRSSNSLESKSIQRGTTARVNRQ